MLRALCLVLGLVCTLCDGLILSRSDARQKCVGGGHLNGTWEYDPAYPLWRYNLQEIAGAWQRFRGYYPKSASYKWVPDSCALLEFDADKFCQALGPRDIYIVGDSTSFMQAQSLHKMIVPYSLEEVEQFVIEGSKMTICGERTLHFVRNDHLMDADIGQPESPHTNSSDPRDPSWQTSYPWVRHLRPNQLLLLNTGIHAYTGHGSNISWYRQNLEQISGYLRTHYKGTRVFRTTTGGHENCALGEDGPVRYEQVLSSKSRSLMKQKADSDTASFIYNWESVPERNAHAKDVFKASDGWHMLDVDPMTRLRNDGHREPPTDCLHYFLPGPPDWWNVLLYNWLLGQIVL